MRIVLRHFRKNGTAEACNRCRRPTSYARGTRRPRAITRRVGTSAANARPEAPHSPSISGAPSTQIHRLAVLHINQHRPCNLKAEAKFACSTSSAAKRREVDWSIQHICLSRLQCYKWQHSAVLERYRKQSLSRTHARTQHTAGAPQHANGDFLLFSETVSTCFLLLCPALSLFAELGIDSSLHLYLYYRLPTSVRTHKTKDKAFDRLVP